MKKAFKTKIFIIFIVFITFFAIACVIIKSNFFVEQIYKHYNGVSFYYITTKITKGQPDTLEKMQTLVDYIHQNVFSGPFQVQDLPPLENLIRGIGWCDQVSHLFIRLIEPLDLKGYLFFLRNSTGASPHSIAVVTPNTKKTLTEYLDVINEGIVVDVYGGTIFKNKSGKPATFSDISSKNIREDQHKYFITGSNDYDWYHNKATIFLSNTPISLDNKKRQIFYRYIYPILPAKVIFLYQDLVLNRCYRKMFNDELFAYFKARNYHIYERYNEAEKLYNTLINSTKDKELASNCLFFQGMLYFRMHRFNEAKEKFNAVIAEYPESPWSSLAQEWQPEAKKQSR